MKLMILEGTPAELADVVKFMDLKVDVAVIKSDEIRTTNAVPPMRMDEAPEKFVTTEFARKLLNRRPVSDAMQAVLRSLLSSGSSWTSSAALYKSSNYNVAQFSGLMGAWGRRMANTEGYDDEAYFFDFRWNDEESAWDYRLPTHLIKVVEEALRTK
jgi:hypothetical protein